MLIRKFPIAILATLLSLFGAGSFAQAQDVSVTEEYCKSINICGSAPKEFTMIMEFSQELINAIHTVGTQGAYVGKYVNPNRFKGNTFTPPKQNIISKVTRNIGQKLNFILATTAIVTSPQQWGGLKDIFAGTLVLFKNKIFGRDLQVVQKLDASLTQKRYELGLGGGRLAVINDENLAEFQKILKSYKEKGLLIESSSISQGATYANVVSMVGRVLAAMKSYLSINTTSQFKEWEKVGFEGTIKVGFSGTMVQNMSKQYTCARAKNNICDNSFKQFAKNMKRINKDTLSGAQKSIDTFADAAKRLAAIFNKNSDSREELAARERELLDTYYGTQKREKGGLSASFDDGGALKSLQQVGKQFSGIFANRRSAAVESESKEISSIDQIKNTTAKPDTTASLATATVVSSTKFTAWMHNGMDTFLDDQTRDLKMISFSEVKDITSVFTTLGQQIATAKAVIGGKDEGGLIQQLGNACELQGGDLEQKCRQ